MVLWLMIVEETQISKTGKRRREKKMLEEENNSSFYPQILANTCPEGSFRHLKIEKHAALGSPPHPPETVTQTAVVIGSERFLFYYIIVFMHL